MHNISKGSIGELLAKAKFLERGLSVYEDEVDIRGVDFIALPYTDEAEPLKIQVKATNSLNKAFRIDEETKADFYFFINTETENHWLIPKEENQKILEDTETSSNLDSNMFNLEPEKWEDYKGLQAIKDKLDKPSFHASRRGRAGENLAIAYLLKNGQDVYEPLTDIRAIDAIIKTENEYLDIQIKYCSNKENGRQFRNVKKQEPRPNYLFLLVVGEPRGYYLMPSNKVMEEAYDTGDLYLTDEIAEEFQGLSYLEEME